MKKCLILGASGFIASHLEYRLKRDGHHVVSVARKHPPFRKSVADELNFLDLANPPEFHAHFYRHSYFDEVYQLAGSVGGLGYIGTGQHDAEILTNSLKINLHTLEAVRKTGNVGKIFFASSQCVYPDTSVSVDPFAAERIAPPIQPWREGDASFNTFAFGQEKLFAEKLYDAYHRNYGLGISIGRIGNTYGPYSVWESERAKAPAALCRKVAASAYGVPVDIWGSAQQTRSFTYVDDVIDGILKLMAADYPMPVNIANAETVTIAELFDTICRVANKVIAYKPVPGPTGSMHRGSDNTRCKQVLNWEPETPLWKGIGMTYPWIREQVDKAAKVA
jgi:nucleoside-diphosphate-sugar epimerase